MSTQRISTTGNEGWTGYTAMGIPTPGYVTTDASMLPVYHAGVPANTAIEELPTNIETTFGVNYFLARGLPYSLGAYPFPYEAWRSIPKSCTPEKGCFVPPLQYCRDTHCKHLSYPIEGSDPCLGAQETLDVIGTGNWTGATSFAVHRLEQ
jgi:hypothetical protein